ncbi:MAG: protein kinase [Actinomycetota bacterium]
METLNLGIDGLDNIEQIGRGGSSRVFRATQVELDRLVALKVLKAGDDPNVVRRFDRERKAMGRLSLNEGIVPVYSTGITDNGEPFLIMPYYENGSLQDRLTAGPVPWAEAVQYIAHAAKTMTAAHEAGVVHLDLKPANILLSSENLPRIADFGIAKLTNDPSGATNTGAAFTPTYSSPEILLGQSATPASDVYGLAATLWALLAGRPPFRAEKAEDNALMAVVGRVVHQPVENLRHIAPDEVCAVVERGMAKEPEQRYPTAGAFAEALNEATKLANARQSRDVGPLFPEQPVEAQDDGTVAMGTTSLNFERTVPPRFEPAAAAPGGIAPARFGESWMVFAIAGIALVAVLGLVALSLGTGDGSADSGVDVEADAPTTAVAETVVEPDDAQEPNGPATSSLPTTSSTSTTASTVATTTATTRQTTTSNDPIPTSSTTDTDGTSSSSETTDTTDSDSTSSSSETTETTDSDSTSSSSETTETTIAQLAAPTDVTARVRAQNILVTWTPPAETDGLTGYQIVRVGGTNGEKTFAAAAGADRLVDDDDLEDGESYTYRVRAIVAAGSPANSPASAPSAPVTFSA